MVISDDETTVYEEKDSIVVPIIGDEIIVKCTDTGDVGSSWDDSDMKPVFKGIVISVSHQLGDNGSIYTVQCADMKSRLMDDTITKVYNEDYDTARKPTFSEKDELLHENKLTVGEIIEDIILLGQNQVFSYNAQYTPISYFSFSDFDFSQVDDLEDYVPEMLNFDGDTLLEAIYKTISSAGSYRMTYDPRDGKLILTKVSLDCEESGDERKLFYATADSDNPNNDYFTDTVTASSGVGTGRVNVIQDNTIKKSSETISVFRMYGGDIEWYSGHFLIDQNHDEYTSSPDPSGNYFLTNRNWDGFKYYFPTNSLGGVYASGQYCIVGCPLYPQWNPLKGYEPFEVTIPEKGMLELPADGHVGSTVLNPAWAGMKENEGYCRVEKMFMPDSKIQEKVREDYSVALGLTYEAWFPWFGECSYCDGSGAVEDASPWAGHEDDWFGNSRDDDGTPNRPALTPFDYQFYTDEFGDSIPQRHPVPWENTCPACRGNGREPRFKITNIYNTLIDLPPSKVRIEDGSEQAVRDRTWQEMVQDLTYSYGPQLQIEYQLSFKGRSVHMVGTAPAHPLAGVTSKTGNTVEIFPSDKKIDSIYKTMISNGDQPAQFDYVRGNVVLNQRHAILCKKAVKRIETHPINPDEYIKSVVNGQLVTSYKNCEKGELSINSYWRPARAWINCYFSRYRFYDRFGDISGENPKTITVTPSGGSPTEYKVAGSVFNNRPVYEVYKKKPGDTEFSVRPIIRSVSIDEYRWQIFPSDYKLYPVPEYDNYSWSAPSGLYYYYMDKGYKFPIGSVHILEALRKNELTGSNFSSDDIMRSDIFPKRTNWVQRDDRYRLIKHAIRELEKKNDLQITGNVVIRGTNFDLANGLGYVDFGDDDKASVVKITHNFKGSYTTQMELSTEEFRLGEKTEREKDTERLMERYIQKYKLANRDLDQTKRVQTSHSGNGSGGQENTESLAYEDGIGTSAHVNNKTD
jgi:hypothetical protein